MSGQPPIALDPRADGRDICHQQAVLLNLCYDFVAAASPATRDELQRFLTAEGLPANTAIGWLTDTLCLMAVNASTCHRHHHTA